MQGTIVKRLKGGKGFSCRIDSHPTEMVLIKGDRMRIFHNEASESLEEGHKVLFTVINQRGKGIYAYITKIK